MPFTEFIFDKKAVKKQTEQYVRELKENSSEKFEKFASKVIADRINTDKRNYWLFKILREMTCP